MKIFSLGTKGNILSYAKRIKDLSENILTDAFTYVLRRWYDADQKIAESFEYLKLLPEDIQKDVALKIINFLSSEEQK